MEGPSAERVRRLLAEAWSVLGTGRSRQAGLALGRILRRDPEVSPAQPPSLRRALVVVWSLVFASLAGGVAGSWDRLVGGLVEPPLPVSGPAAPPVTELAAPTAGESALAQAKRLLEQGDPLGAMAALDRVPPADPAYPSAERLLLEAKAALGRVRQP